MHVPAEARHLMELHGLKNYEGWPAWDKPDGYERLRRFLGLA
jgi:hypothetical protein